MPPGAGGTLLTRYLNIALNLLSVVLLAAGAALAVAIFVPQLWMPAPTMEEGSPQMSQVSGISGGDGGPSGGDSSGAEPAPAAPAGPENPERSTAGPEDKTLAVTIPGMRRVEDDRVPSTTGSNERALRRNVAIHLKGTGYPWQEEANVYLAGHRIGFPRTESFLGFYDLHRLERGDEIHLTDSEGKDYTYRVYRQEVVRPTNTTVTEPVEGRNILTLQTCTLPDYTQRLIVQAEKVA